MTTSAGPRLLPGQLLAYELRLDLHDLDLDRLDAARARRQDGLVVTTLAAEAARDPAAIERAYTLHDACYRLQPPEGSRAPIPFALWRWGSLESRDEALPDAYFLAVVDGAYVGLSTAMKLRRRPEALASRFTGVLPAYRGRGIATALKLASVRYAAKHGYAELRTTVFATNTPMLRVNAALGYVREREFVHPSFAGAALLTADGQKAS